MIPCAFVFFDIITDCKELVDLRRRLDKWANHKRGTEQDWARPLFFDAKKWFGTPDFQATTVWYEIRQLLCLGQEGSPVVFTCRAAASLLVPLWRLCAKTFLQNLLRKNLKEIVRWDKSPVQLRLILSTADENGR